MKKIILLLNVLLILYSGIQAQEVTKGQLMDLNYKAQKAEKAGNMQEALDIYKTILSIDPNLPTPYLKMANIYAADENNGELIAFAIALYNKYLNLKPNDENASAIKNKVANLQKIATNEPNVNLSDMIYI
jgi:tetratricopeptide (TPR) repeat protein